MSCVAIIPARGGSKRLPGKNRMMFHGQPIIAYSIDAAKQSGLFDRIIVSTDDAQIAHIARQYGAENIVQPKGDKGTPWVMATALWELASKDNYKPEYACCIYATAPMINVDDLVTGYRLLRNDRHNYYKPRGYQESLYSFAMGTEPPKDAGQWYWARTETWIEGVELVGPHSIMVPVSADRVCDINTAEDFVRAEEMFAELHGLEAA